MQATQSLDAAMARLGITVQVRYVGDSADSTGWKHHKFSFMLDVRGERLISNGSYSAGMGHKTEADPVDVFGSILSDCSSVEPYANDDAEEERNVWPQTRSAWPDRWDEWAGDLGWLENADRGQLRKHADDFRDIMNRRALLRDRLGVAEYDALLEIAQEL